MSRMLLMDILKESCVLAHTISVKRILIFYFDAFILLNILKKLKKKSNNFKIYYDYPIKRCSEWKWHYV